MPKRRCGAVTKLSRTTERALVSLRKADEAEDRVENFMDIAELVEYLRSNPEHARRAKRRILSGAFAPENEDDAKEQFSGFNPYIKKVPQYHLKILMPKMLNHEVVVLVPQVKKRNPAVWMQLLQRAAMVDADDDNPWLEVKVFDEVIIARHAALGHPLLSLKITYEAPSVPSICWVTSGWFVLIPEIEEVDASEHRYTDVVLAGKPEHCDNRATKATG